MNEPRTKYRISLTTASGHTHVLEGECSTFVFATEGKAKEENLAYIGSSPTRAAVLIGSLFSGLERVSPGMAARLLASLEDGTRTSFKRVLVPEE